MFKNSHKANREMCAMQFRNEAMGGQNSIQG